MTALYEKIGGADAVGAAVDIFYKKVLEDPAINHFFENVDLAKQRLKQKAFLTLAFGGPKDYLGKSMREGHKHLDLKEEHFNAVAGHLQKTLEELNVPGDLLNEVMTIAASTKDDVLGL